VISLTIVDTNLKEQFKTLTFSFKPKITVRLRTNFAELVEELEPAAALSAAYWGRHCKSHFKRVAVQDLCKNLHILENIPQKASCEKCPASLKVPETVSSPPKITLTDRPLILYSYTESNLSGQICISLSTMACIPLPISSSSSMAKRTLQNP
jgi:hypothetical protein